MLSNTLAAAPCATCAAVRAARGVWELNDTEAEVCWVPEECKVEISFCSSCI